MGRSILAVLAGIVTLSILSFGIEAVAGNENKALMAVYTLLSVCAGGYVTAWIALRSPITHAVIMGAIELLMTIAVLFTSPASFPLWSWITSLALIVPAAWLGAKLRVSRTNILL